MIISDDWTIVFNPRTASRSLAAALNETGEFGYIKHGHPRPEWVIKQSRSSRIIGVLRDPMTWVWSHYFKAKVWPDIGFEEWLDANHGRVGIYWNPGRLNAYRDIITEYWRFDRGYAGLMDHLGMKKAATEQKIGYEPKPIQPYWYQGIAEYFPEECALYDHIGVYL